MTKRADTSPPSGDTPDETGTSRSEPAETSDPTDVKATLDALDAQIAGSERMKRWSDVLKAMLQKVDLLIDPLEQANVLTKSARLALERLSNKAAAIRAYERVLAIDESDPEALTKLSELYEERRDWENLVDVRMRWAESFADAVDLLPQRIEVARLASERVRKPELLIQLWRRVEELDPDNAEALAQLSALYERARDWQPFAEVLEKQASLLADADERLAVLQKLGLVYADKLGDDAGAVRAFQAILALAPGDRRAQEQLKKRYVSLYAWDDLESFYAQTDGWDELLRTLERESDRQGIEPAVRIDLLLRAARIWSDKKAEKDRAARTYEKVLAIDAQNLAAARSLAPIYQEAGDTKKLAAVLEIRLGHTTDAAERAMLLEHLEKLRAPAPSFQSPLEAFQVVELPEIVQPREIGRRRPVQKTHFKTSPKASTSLWSLAERKRLQQRPMAAAMSTGFAGADTKAIHESDRVAVIVEMSDPSQAGAVRPANLQPDEHMDPLDPDGRFWSAQVSVDRVRGLWSHPAVARVETKKRDELMLDKAGMEVGVLAPAGGRAVLEDGTGVLVGVVDSGFDLTHPMFRDAAGSLRVAALLDQTTRPQQELTPAQLAAAVIGAGTDGNGHGTHVASIAAGSSFGGLVGIAPGAHLLLVKTDFVNTDRAVRWVFDKAAALGRPCVVNLSLGNHFGAHDGTDAKERLYARLTRDPGRVVVVSAGNEQGDRVHVGGRFSAGQTEEVTFDVLPRGAAPFVTITAWHDERDIFDGGLVTPSGQLLAWPDIDSTDTFGGTAVQLEVARARHPMGRAVKVQVTLEFDPTLVRARDLRGWRLRFTCQQAVVGRLDAWANNSGFAAFHDHPMLEDNRIVGIPGTGDGTITVASYVTKSQWTSDGGAQADGRVVLGRISPFSSVGPTRDGREKPDVAAPGQYVTAALATASDFAQHDDRADTPSRLLTIEGTSMAAPVVTGVVACLLQKNPTLTLAQIRDALMRSARRDAHTGAARWDPSYGFGKVDLAAALALV